jgi:hypothetical protein
MNIGTVEQCADRRNQHHIVGPNQFPQLLFSFAATSARRFSASCPCRASRRFLLL